MIVEKIRLLSRTGILLTVALLLIGISNPQLKGDSALLIVKTIDIPLIATLFFGFSSKSTVEAVLKTLAFSLLFFLLFTSKQTIVIGALAHVAIVACLHRIRVRLSNHDGLVTQSKARSSLNAKASALDKVSFLVLTLLAASYWLPQLVVVSVVAYAVLWLGYVVIVAVPALTFEWLSCSLKQLHQRENETQ